MAKFQRDIINLRFPAAGVVRRVSFQNQSEYSTYAALNVFPDDPFLERERGGSRPPLKFDYSCPGICNLLAEMVYISAGVRKRKLLIGGGGDLNIVSEGGGTASASGLSSDLNLTGGEFLSKFYIAMGSGGELMVFDPADDSLGVLAATEGTVPTNCRCCIRWRDRIVVAEDSENPHEIYMSRQGDAQDWDYTQEDVQRAVMFSATAAGRIGQPVRALIPHSNNCLLIATNSEWYVLRSDPTAGGYVMLINDQIGITSRNAWCHTPDGWLFTLTQDGLYMMPPGCGDQLQSVSREKLPKELIGIFDTRYTVSMCYDRRLRGILIGVTKTGADDLPPDDTPPFPPANQGTVAPLGSSLGTSHFFVDIRSVAGSDNTSRYTASFWPFSLNGSLEPTYMYASREIDDDPSALIGTRSMGVHHFEQKAGSSSIPGATPEDVQPTIEEEYPTYLLYGPIRLGKLGTIGLFESIQPIIARDSGEIEWELYIGDDAETFLLSEEPVPVAKGVWNKAGELQGLGYVDPVRVRGSYAYLLIKNGEEFKAWSIEGIQVKRQSRPGRQRRHYESDYATGDPPIP